MTNIKHTVTGNEASDEEELTKLRAFILKIETARRSGEITTAAAIREYDSAGLAKATIKRITGASPQQIHQTLHGGKSAPVDLNQIQTLTFVRYRGK